jgi:ParB-like chromosome segregation protein Spo0J
MSENEQTTRLISIDQIRPDPSQPRKLLPPDLSKELAAGASPINILDQLRARAEHNRRRPELAEGWLAHRLADLDALAHSIGEDGLINPIRVFSDGSDRYTIEAGERRWWAHHILVMQGKEEDRKSVV